MISYSEQVIRFALAVLFAMQFCGADFGISSAHAQRPENGPPPQPGLKLNTPKAFDGYTLISPLLSNQTYLANTEGKIVHMWECDCTPGQTAYLLENGNLLRPGKLNGKDQKFTNGGDAGIVQEYTWDGDLVWDFRFHNDKQLAHHDICRLPNGNILMLVWEKKSAAEMIAAGRNPKSLPGETVLVDTVVEIKPVGKKGGKIVWEWRLWDHLIQDHDKTKANYGDVAAHPELVDINFGEHFDVKFGHQKDAPEEKQKDKKQGPGNQGFKGPGGYVGGGINVPIIPDWTHINSITYNPKLDQILLTSRSLSEIWIIDHSTKTDGAALHEGGRGGKGGDLLYRWGNPAAYRAGKAADQKLFTPHAAHWIPDGIPGEGHVLVFNNGGQSTARHYSSVDEIALPVDAEGKYPLKVGSAYGPEKLEWSYTAAKKKDFLAEYFSNAQRLPNGNTLICAGEKGIIFEVSSEKELVWEFVNPIMGKVIGRRSPRGDERPKFGTLIPDDLQAMLKMTPQQKKDLAEFQQEIFKELDRLLTAEQKKLMMNPKSLGNVAPPLPAKIFTFDLLRRLKMTDEQKDTMGELQLKANKTLKKILTEDQKIFLEGVKPKSKRAQGDKEDIKDSGGKDGEDAKGKDDPDELNSVFAVVMYGPKYPGLAGKELKPLPPLPKDKEFVPVRPREKSKKEDNGWDRSIPQKEWRK